MKTITHLNNATFVESDQEYSDFEIELADNINKMIVEKYPDYNSTVVQTSDDNKLVQGISVWDDNEKTSDTLYKITVERIKDKKVQLDDNKISKLQQTLTNYKYSILVNNVNKWTPTGLLNGMGELERALLAIRLTECATKYRSVMSEVVDKYGRIPSIMFPLVKRLFDKYNDVDLDILFLTFDALCEQIKNEIPNPSGYGAGIDDDMKIIHMCEDKYKELIEGLK